jgi:hypothetical protein
MNSIIRIAILIVLALTVNCSSFCQDLAAGIKTGASAQVLAVDVCNCLSPANPTIALVCVGEASVYTITAKIAADTYAQFCATPTPAASAAKAPQTATDFDAFFESHGAVRK